MKLVKPFEHLPNIKQDDYNESFQPYVFLPKLFNENEVNRINALWSEDSLIEAKVGSDGKGLVDYDKRKSEIIFLKTGENDWIYDKLAMACILTNANRYKFDIRGFQTQLQLTRYSEGGFFGWHMDYGNNRNSIRKLSITVQLSAPDEYDGGALQFLKGNETINAPKEQGTAIIFPSYVAHRVETVTRGVRKSIVGWIAGPTYR